MPNGGIPIHMVLYPRGTPDLVVYCHGSKLKVFTRTEWDAKGVGGDPMLSLSPAEAGSLAWFISEWSDSSQIKPGYETPDVNADFDF